MKQQTRKTSLAALTAACFITGLLLIPVCTRVENIAYDLRMKVVSALSSTYAAQYVAVAAINEQSILAKKPFVFWYPELGRFCKRMGEMGAKAVGIDLIPVHSLETKLQGAFTGSGFPGFRVEDLSSLGRYLDQSLVQGIMEGGRRSPVVQGVSGTTTPFYYDILSFMEQVTPASLRVFPDKDSVVRIQPGSGESGMRGFAAELMHVSGFRTPFPKELAINYTLLPGVPVLDFEDLIAGKVDPARVRGRIILLGLSSAHEDIHETSVGSRAGMLIHATAIETLLSGRTITRSGTAVSLLLLALLALFSSPLAESGSPGRSILMLSSISLAYAGTSFALFAFGFVIPLFPHALIPLLTFCISYPYRYVVVERQGRYLKRAFSSYVAPELVEQIVANPDRLKLGGERREVTVIISDIRQFTTFSEKIGPEQLVKLLNRYHDPMTRIVMKERGTLIQYVGDEIMALFNAPVETPDHPACACRCALSMMESLRHLNVELAEAGFPVIDIGIGVNSGEVIVGNMGIESRFQYSALGDTVNLASRLEGLNKQYGTHILINQTTRMLAGDEFHYREVDLVRVKGKTLAVAISELLPAPFPAIEKYSAALRLYRGQQFAEAQEMFESLASELDDPVSRLYAQRCIQFRKSPPPEEWDGVYVATEK